MPFATAYESSSEGYRTRVSGSILFHGEMVLLREKENAFLKRARNNAVGFKIVWGRKERKNSILHRKMSFAGHFYSDRWVYFCEGRLGLGSGGCEGVSGKFCSEMWLLKANESAVSLHACAVVIVQDTYSSPYIHRGNV